jgi:hypothetical protein
MGRAACYSERKRGRESFHIHKLRKDSCESQFPIGELSLKVGEARLLALEFFLLGRLYFFG